MAQSEDLGHGARVDQILGIDLRSQGIELTPVSGSVRPPSLAYRCKQELAPAVRKPRGPAETYKEVPT